MFVCVWVSLCVCVCMKWWHVSSPGPPLVPIRRFYGAISYLMPPILMNIRLYLYHGSFSFSFNVFHDNISPICVYCINRNILFLCISPIISHCQSCAPARPLHLRTHASVTSPVVTKQESRFQLAFWLHPMERSQHANNQTFTCRQMNNVHCSSCKYKSESVHFMEGKI